MFNHFPKLPDDMGVTRIGGARCLSKIASWALALAILGSVCVADGSALATSTAISPSLRLSGSDKGWTVLTLSDRQLVLQHRSNHRFVYINEFPSQLKKTDVDAYLATAQFLKEMKESRKNAAASGIAEPSELEISTRSQEGKQVASLFYAIATPSGQSNFSERIWAGASSVWQLTTVFTDEASVKQEEQTKLTDNLMSQIVVQEFGIEHGSKAARWKVILDALAVEPSEADETARGLPARATREFGELTPQQCANTNIAPEYRQLRPPFKLQASWDLHQCPTAAVHGALQAIFNMEMGPEFVKVADCVDKIAQRKCGMYPQLAAGDTNYVAYNERTNRWFDCTGIDRSGDAIACLGNDVEKRLSGAGSAVVNFATKHPLITLMTMANLPLGLALAAQTQITSQFADSLVRDPIKVFSAVCQSVDGLACMKPEAQTVAWCNCVGDAGTTLGSMVPGAVALANAMTKAKTMAARSMEVAEDTARASREAEAAPSALADGRTSFPPVPSADLENLVERKAPRRFSFVKDAPVLAYKITSDRFEDIPPEIREHLGVVDRTKYTPEYLRENIGSVIALQMDGARPDFYLIGKDTFNAKYLSQPTASVVAKNKKYFDGVSAQIPSLLNGQNANLVAVLKTTPTSMVRLSDIGYPVNREITIESPWGTQTKPANQDAFLVWDEKTNKYYMVNAGADGNPLSYVPSSPRP